MRILAFTLGAVLLAAAPVAAQQTVIKFNGGTPLIGPEQQLMLKAAEAVMHKDYAAALSLYDQVLAANGGHIEAYLQRSVVKREMQDAGGSQADAAQAVRLADMALQQSSTPQKTAKLHYQRGTGYRFLKDFARAKADMQEAMRLAPGRGDWRTDFRAIELEEKIAAGG